MTDSNTNKGPTFLTIPYCQKCKYFFAGTSAIGYYQCTLLKVGLEHGENYSLKPDKNCPYLENNKKEYHQTEFNKLTNVKDYL